MADVIAVGNWCCLQQHGHLSKPEANCGSCCKHCFSLCVECAAVCIGFSERYTGKVGVGDGGRLLAMWTMVELWEGVHWKVGNSGGKKTLPVFNQSYVPDNSLVFRCSSMYCWCPIIFFLTFFLFHNPLFSSHSAFGDWRHDAFCSQQMKSI